MTFLLDNKTTLMAALLGALLIGGYYVFWGGSSEPSLVQTQVESASLEGQQLLAILGDLHALTLDDAIFKDPVFVSLNDYGVVIPVQPLGRSNPFAPVAATPAATSPRVPGTR